MNSIHKRAAAAGISTLTREQNEELYNRLLAGDEQARRTMIEGNMALAVSKAGHYVLTFPEAAFMQADLISEGLLALTQAVEDMRTSPRVADPNPTAYICLAIQRAIGHLVDGELHLQAPSRTIRRRRKNGNPVVTPPQVEMDPMHIDEVQDPMAMSDLRDLIDSCCECEEERAIVVLREKGYVDQEIARTLGIPHSTTYVMRRGIYKRFLEKSV